MVPTKRFALLVNYGTEGFQFVYGSDLLSEVLAAREADLYGGLAPPLIIEVIPASEAYGWTSEIQGRMWREKETK